MFNGFDIMSIGRYDKHHKLYFFITVRTSRNKLLFGKVNSATMVLSSYGKIASNRISLFNSVHESIFVEDSVIMPNHVHIVLSLKKSGLEFEPTENELKSFISDLVEEYKSLTSKETELFLKEIAVFSDEDLNIWHSGCNVKIIDSLNDYGKIIHHVSKNAEEWLFDKYCPSDI